jgi:2-polyprenyl-3-methyl-5-hydroxy-6-metoxy-1,4-benzoquinol methylase
MFDVKISNCPLCNSRDIDMFYESDTIEVGTINGKVKINSKVSGCNQCGFVFLAPRKSQRWYSKFYKNQNRTIGDRDKKEHTKKQKAEYDFITKHVNHKLNVFDIGAFDGGLLSHFKKNGWVVSGNELSSVSCDFAKVNHDIDLINDTEITDEQYLITCSNVLEHIYDINEFMNEVTTKLIKNGYLYIEVPNLEYCAKWNNISEFFIFQHLNYFTPRTLKCLLQKHGLTIVSETTAGPWIRALATNNYDDGIEDYLVNREQLLAKLGEIKGDIAIYGAGQHTSQILRYLQCNVVAILDSNDDLAGKSMYGIPILHVSQVNQFNSMIVSSYDFQENMVKTLKQLKFQGNIITLYDSFYFKDYK